MVGLLCRNFIKMENGMFKEKERGLGCEMSINDEQSPPLQVELTFFQ